MTERTPSQDLAALFRAEADDPIPNGLLASVLAIPQTMASDQRRRLGRGFLLLAAAALIGVLLVGSALVIGAGILPPPDDQLIPSGNTAVAMKYPERDLYLVDLTTGEERLLMAGLTYMDGAAWSPDRATIAVQGGRTSGGQTLYLVDAASGEIRDLGLGPSTADVVLAWSPDGSAIAVSGRQSYDDPIALQVVDVADRSVAVVGAAAVPPTTSWSNHSYIHDADWSPSGERLAFLVGRHFCAFNATWRGTVCGAPEFSDQGCQLVVAPSAPPGSPVVHDLGKSCAWHSLAWIDEQRVFAGVDGRVDLVDVDTGTSRAVVLNEWSEQVDTLKLSPERRHFFSFNSAVQRPAEPRPEPLRVMDLEGNLVLELDLPCLPMSRDIAGNIGGTDGLGCGLFWAPDGRRLLITREDGAWMVDLTEGRLRELTVPDVEFVFW